MHRIISAVVEINNVMGGPELDQPGARLAFLVVAGNLSLVLRPPELRVLAEALPLGPALVLLRPFEEDRSQCADVAAFHVHIVCRILAAFVKGETALRLRGDVPARLCRALMLPTVELPRALRPMHSFPPPAALRPTFRIPSPERRSARPTRPVRAA